MKKLFILLILILFATFCLAEGSDSGKLEELEKELNRPADNNDHDDDDDEDDSDCDDEEDGNFFFDLFSYIFYHLFIGIPGERAERQEFLWGYGFSEYPYSPGNFGVYDVYSDKTSRFNFSTKYFYHDDRLDGQSLAATFSVTPFLSFRGSYLKLQEELKYSTDKMEIYDLYLNYIRFHTEYVIWWWGLGAKHVIRDDNYTGFSLSTGWEIYFLEPFSFDLSLNNAFIRSRMATEINCNLKLHLYNFYIQAGYLREGFGSEFLNGFTAGVGVNF
jgi:hypothetical protein